MQDGPRTRHGKIQLEVPVVVPGKRSNAVAGTDAELFEGMRQLRDPLAEVAVGVTMTARLAPGDDLLGWKQGGRSPEEMLERQWEIRHRAAHRESLLPSAGGAGRLIWPSQYHHDMLATGGVSPVMARPENASGSGITLRRS